MHFSRNFGKEAAIVAGLAQACGDAVAVMDCDLQHPPEILLEMYRLWKQGYEVVEGIKKNRGKKLFSQKKCRIFYRIMSRATGFDMENASRFQAAGQESGGRVFSPCLNEACFPGGIVLDRLPKASPYL